MIEIIAITPDVLSGTFVWFNILDSAIV